MLQEIKQRIEQIRNGEVPEGYANTPAGILPKEWSCAKLSDISEVITETAGERAIETVSISAGIGFVNQAQKFGKELSGNQYSKYIVLHKGDFAYNKGNSNRYPQGCTYMLKERETAAVPNVFECFRIRDGAPTYYEQLFLFGFMNKQLARLINHGVRDDGLLNLTDKDFYSVVLPVPSIAEQRKIAEILATCDRVIELKQKLIDELKQLKKICLAKMFPQKGSMSPEIRFPRFTTPWEKCKLVTLCEKFVDGDWIESKDQSNSGVRLIQTGNVGVTEYLDKPSNKKWVSEETFDRLHCEEVLPGDILISRLPEPAGRACIIPFLGTKMITAVDCTIVRTASDVSNRFLVQYLSSQPYFDEVNSCLAGGTRQRISRSNLANFDILIPQKRAEQDTIGSFFAKLDSLITLHQREMEQGRQKKKAFMQLLLSGIVRVQYE